LQTSFSVLDGLSKALFVKYNIYIRQWKFLMNNEEMVLATENWVRNVVVGLNFCPFARRELDNSRVRFVVTDSAKRKEVLESFLDECQLLDADASIETTLIILPNGLADFSNYLDLVEMLEELLLLEGYEGVYQVASFHPDYCFADADIDDPANYTNRSPYPMLHLLREESLENAIASHPDVDGIPETNIHKAREMGLEAMRQLFRQSKP
jgi:uncharacterized protein